MSNDPQQDDNPFAPPTARIEDIIPATDELQLAERGTRLAAYIVDILSIVAVGMVVGFLGLTTMFFGNMGTTASAVAIMMLGFIGFVLVNGYLLITRGQSIGKIVFGIRIVRSDGSPANAGHVLGLRYIVNWAIASIPIIGSIYSLVDSLCIFRDSRKCLHDDIADTIVVNVKGPLAIPKNAP